jgi:hypothetical protein
MRSRACDLAMLAIPAVWTIRAPQQQAGVVVPGVAA